MAPDSAERTYEIRPEEDRLTVGPYNGVRSGEVRVQMGEQMEVFRFLPSRALEYTGGVFTQPEGRPQDEYALPSDVFPGLRISFNVEAGWLRVQRTGANGPLITVTVNFPGDSVASASLGPRKRWTR